VEAITLYTSRHADSDRLFYDRFTEQTGVAVRAVTGGSEALIARLEAEGSRTAADLFVTGDAGNLFAAKNRRLLQPVKSERLRRQIPEKLRDADHEWFGLTRRVRLLVYNKANVDPAELSTYEALAEPRWRGRIRMRSSDNVYNRCLLASFIEVMGEESAGRWAQGIAANLGRAPGGDDFDQIRKLAAGRGDVSIVNHYYFVKMLRAASPADARDAEAVGLFFPNRESTGVHVNVSGIAVTRYARHKEAAVRFIEFLTDEAVQSAYAESKHEYPVHLAAQPSGLLQSWGDFRAQDIHVEALNRNRRKAMQLFERAGWK